MILPSLLILAANLLGVSMHSQQPSQPVQSAASGLPYVTDSPSALLAATNVFAMTPLSVNPSTWVLGPDQFEHREVRVKARLAEIFKGRLNAVPSEEFAFSVPQERETGGMVSDYHGLWSHTTLTPGKNYLIVARGFSPSLADLLKQENCRAVLDQAFIEDVKAALAGEVAYQAIVVKSGPPSAVAASLALLAVAQEKAAVVHDLFEGYLWARVGPTFDHSEKELRGRVLDLVSAPNGTVLFRGALIADVYQTAVRLEPNPELTRAVVRDLFALLHQPSAKPLAAHLVEVELYNLTVRDGNANLAVDTVFPDRAERAAYRASLAPFDTDRAHQIENWLSR
jgi:hypothetical protein